MVIAQIALAAATRFGAPGSAHADGDVPLVNQAVVIPDDSNKKNGDVAELENLIRDGKITELRKTYNGSYGASLSYYADSMI